jgi:hypothetical protein
MWDSTEALTTDLATAASDSSAANGAAGLCVQHGGDEREHDVVRNVYVNRTVINNTTVVNRASFNGEGGVAAQPRPEEQAAMREQHFQPTENQVSHEQAMSHDRNQLASFNHGTPGTAAMDSVNGRRFNQQGRIAQGISSGQLTPGETKNLENREAHLNGEIHNDRAANGGTLTPQERQQVNRQQNNLSRSIYNDKHNAATDITATMKWAPGATCSSSASPTALPAGNVAIGDGESRESRAEHQPPYRRGSQRQWRQADASGESQNINQRQNNASRQIYNGRLRRAKRSFFSPAHLPESNPRKPR